MQYVMSGASIVDLTLIFRIGNVCGGIW